MPITQPYRIYPKQASVPRQQANRPVNIPAPVGGWNTREQLAGMPPTDAVQLINMVPRQGYCEMRGGYAFHSGLAQGDGSELVTNGAFATDTDWTKDANWAIAAGVATHTTGAADSISQSIAVTEGTYYIVEFDITGRTAGSVTASLGGTNGTARSADDTDIQEFIKCGATTTLSFTATSDFDGSIDNVSVQEGVDIDTVVEWYDGSGSRVLLAATSTNIYNATSSAATSLVGSQTSGRWDTAMMNGIMGLVNGSDAPKTFNGTSISTMTVSGSGLTVANLVGILVFKNRSYFWETGSQRFWYSALDTLGGTLSEFALGEVISTGGKLLRLTSWTVDGGDGPDDYFVAVFDTGEVAVYQGDDPSSALSWAIVGKYEIGAAVNDRAFVKFGGQVGVVTESDLIFMPTAFNTPSPPTTKLSGAISDSVRAFGATPDGWELFHYKNESLLMVNVPTAITPDIFEQYVLNLETGAACRFTNMNARCWTLFDDEPYFGGSDGVVYKFDRAYSDAGADIDVTVQQAWSSMGIPNYKKVTGVRPVFEASDTVSVDTAVGGDYKLPESVSSPSSTVVSGTPWGSPWGSSWGAPTPGIYREWKLASGRGTTISLLTKFSRQGDKPKLLNTDALIMPGGNL